MKRLLFGLLGALIAAMLLAALVLFFPPAFKLGLRTANRFLPVTVDIEGYRHVPGRLDLSKVRVETSTGTLCELADLSIAYRPTLLALGRIDVSSLDVRDPRVTISLASADQSHTEEPNRPAQEGTGSLESWGWLIHRVRIEKIQAAEGSLRVVGLEDDLALEWSSLDMEGSFSGHPLEAKLLLREGSLEAGRGTEPPLQMSTEGHGSLTDGLVRLVSFNMTSRDTTLSFKGEHSVPEQKTHLDAELAELPLDRFLEVFGVGGVGVERVSGRLELDVEGLDRPAVEADLSGVIYGQNVRARIKGRVTEDDVLLESVALTNPEVRATGKARLVPSSGRMTGEFQVKSASLEESFRPYEIDGMRVLGLQADGTLGGTFQAPEIQFRLHTDEIAFVEPLLENLHADGGYSLDRGLYVQGTAGTVPFLREAADGAKISASLRDGVAACEIEAEPSLRLAGDMTVKDLRTEVSVQAQGLDLSFLAEQWVRSASILSLNGKGRFLGHLDRKETWTGEAAIDELLFKFPGLVIESSRPVNVRIAEGRLLGEASFKANGRPLSVQGSYPLTSEGNLALQGNADLALEDFLEPARSFLPSLRAWRGELRVKGSLEGPASSPRLRAHAELSDGSFRLTFLEEQDREPSSETEEEDTEGVGEEVEPGEIRSGDIRMRLELDGAIAEPAGSLELRLRENRVYGIPLDEVRLEASSRDGRKWTPSAVIRSSKASVSLDGQWEVPTGAIAGEIRSTELDLADLVSRENMPVQGISRIEGSLAGTTSAPRVELRAHTRELTIQDIPVGTLDTDLIFDPARLHLKGKTDTGWFEAAIGMKEEQTFSFQGSLEGFPVGPLLEAANLRGWTGRASLSGNLEGPMTDIQRWEGEIELGQLDLREGEDSLQLVEPASFRFAGGNVTIPLTTLRAGNSHLRLKGSLGRQNNLTVKGTLPLRPFKALIPLVRFDTGEAETDLTLRGSTSSPLLDGRVHLTAGQVKVPGLAYPADSVDAVLRAESNRFTLQSLHANVAEGELRGSGAMTLKPLAFEDVRASLRAVPIRLSDSLVGNLHGDLAFEGDREDSLLSGTLKIIEARYEEDFSLVGMVLLPSRPRKTRIKKADPFLKNMAMDLRVESGPNLFVRNNLGRLILSTNMEIRGTAARPVPLGIVRAEEGRIFYSNKRFDITQGSLAFSDPSGGKPRLQLESKVKIQGQSREYLIYLTLMGPLDRIELELRSVPNLEREDIIFVLLTGKTRDEYYAASEESTDMEETAQRLAVSGIGALFGGQIRALTGLDTFVMERTEGEDFGVKTTVGKQFNERVDVRGVFALGSGQQVSEAQVGYLLTDMFYVVGTQRTDGSFGLDFRLRVGSR